MIQYNCTYDICGIVILLIILLVHGRQKKVVLLQNKLFNCLLGAAFVMTIADLLDCITTMNAENMPVWILHLTSYTYFLALTLVALLYALYSLSLRDNKIIRNQAVLTLGLCMPLFVMVIMIVANPFNHLLFYYDKYKAYHRGDAILYVYLVCFFYVIFGSFYAMQNKKNISSSIRVSLYAFLLFACGASLFQLYNAEQVVTCFSISVCVLLLYTNIQKPDTLIDPIVGVLNKNCFSKLFEVSVKSKTKVYAIVLYLEDIAIVNTALGIEKTNIILANVGKFLETYGDVQIYYLNSGTFVAITEDLDFMRKMSVDIIKRFEEKWEAGDLSVNMSVRILTACIQDDISTIDSFYNYIDYLKGLDNSSQLQISASELHLDNSKRRAIVEKRIVEAIENDNFQMYYQPIISTETGKVVSAEALIRLFSDDYGFIPPDEFIPIAEKNGLIQKIGDIVFRKVFDFMSKNKLIEKGIEYIDINLSVVQCMQEDMAEKLIDMLKTYEIDHSQVKLEITETAAANSPRMLLQNMNELWKHNIHFALDDYGSGYSNIDYVMDLPFQTIKFDKHFIDKATSTEKGRILFESSVNMMKKLKLKMVAEGVETKEQYEQLKEMGVEFLQGYYFAKPIPGIEFIHFVNRFNGNN